MGSALGCNKSDTSLSNPTKANTPAPAESAPQSIDTATVASPNSTETTQTTTPDTALSVRVQFDNVNMPGGESNDEVPHIAASVQSDDQLAALRATAKAARRGKNARASIVMDINKERKEAQYEKLYLQKKSHQKLTSLDEKQLSQSIFLPRGGTYVTSSVGAVQFGMPPETIKDSMTMGLPLPLIYVLPKERFNLELGINVAEFEFPAYFCFFVRRQKITLVVEPQVEQVIRDIFQETLLGPKDIEYPDHYGEHCSKEQYPDLAKELSNFRVNPFDKTELTVDTLLSFVHFKDAENGEYKVAKLSDEVTIRDNGDVFSVYEGTEELVTVHSKVVLAPPEEYVTVTMNNARRDSANVVLAEPKSPQLKGEKKTTEKKPQTTKSPIRTVKLSLPYEPLLFVPPYFGITMLGNSDGFDKTGSTTGFLLWLNRRGIMVDPPPHSGLLLKRSGIHPRQIGGIILTHCHADHDAGTFQKVLEEGRVTVYTTKVILDSFLRKYSAISGLSQALLRSCFIWRPITVGHMTAVYGGHLNFFYSLHTIPCVGFEAYCGGKSMVYSADTYNDPTGITAIYDKGLMSAGRRDALLNFPWHHDVILHEAGVPPIHTPITTLEALPKDVKERLYIVHKPTSQIKPESGLKSALVGAEHTITIVEDKLPNSDGLEILELVGNIEVFSDLMVSRASELIQCAEYKFYTPGQVVVEEGVVGNSMYVIALGSVSVQVNGQHMKFLTVGDHFGEHSLITGGIRSASIVAATTAEVIVYSIDEFLHMVRETKTIEKLIHLGQMQNTDSWQTINMNTLFGSLSSAQKTYLQSILKEGSCKKGEHIWQSKSKVTSDAVAALIIRSGQMLFQRANDVAPFEAGAFVGDMRALLTDNVMTTTLVAVADSTYFYFTKSDFTKFLDHNPGVLIQLMNRRFRE